MKSYIALYLAGRYSRREELHELAKTIGEMNTAKWEPRFFVSARWLTGEHEWTGTPDGEIPVEDQAGFAQEDLNDIMNCDVMVCFTEPAGQGSARGGRHVEFGYAIAHRMPVLLVGPRENIFYSLPNVIQIGNKNDLLAIFQRVRSHSGWGLDPMKLLLGYAREYEAARAENTGPSSGEIDL